ncbi:MAG TPA: DUF58 domain-containing protein [Steroidobacteraceae bacterium]|nr:DUF58 domain-containing protein [Steroidobacteraceae bacterium]
MQRLLDPAVLSAISSLELIARTVVDGFVAGLHRSADFGFSQEFAEYRAYAPGDDLRHVDWNVFARTERTYLKRFHGETNSALTLLLDASSSMRFGSGATRKLDYARFAAAALAYLAIRRQRDAAGLIVFDDVVREVVAPTSRAGQLQRLLGALERAEPRARTRFAAPLERFQGLLHRRGIVVLLSDFYESPATILRAVEPLGFRGNELVLFHVLDPEELHPTLDNAAVLVDLETQAQLDVSAEYARQEYPQRIAAHIEALRAGARAAGIGYRLLPTHEPLDGALREYLAVRQGRD